MSCDEVRELVSAHADGELDLVHHARVEAHLGECAACSEARERVLALRETVRGALSFEIPPGLEAAVRTQLRRADRRAWRPTWLLQLAAVLAVGALLGFLLRPAPPSGVERELVASHVRSLMPGHLIDVPSSDRHTVKPWFLGKVDFAPSVPDVPGFPLEGGRLDYLGGRPVAALVYERRLHRINVFEWPASGPDEPRTRTATREGYTIFRWTRSGMSFAAVSDVAPDELEELVGRFER